LAHLQSLPLKRLEFAFVAVGIQTVLIYLALPADWTALTRVPALLVSYVCMTVFFVANRTLSGMWLIGAGFLLNGLVIALNGGYMPITYEALVAVGRTDLVASSAPGSLVLGSKDILLPTAQTRLAFLSDIFVLPQPFPLSSVFSLGDVLLMLGMFRLIPRALANPNARPALLNSNSA
jgi:hypothetical protein